MLICQDEMRNHQKKPNTAKKARGEEVKRGRPKSEQEHDTSPFQGIWRPQFPFVSIGIRTRPYTPGGNEGPSFPRAMSTVDTPLGSVQPPPQLACSSTIPTPNSFAETGFLSMPQLPFPMVIQKANDQLGEGDGITGVRKGDRIRKPSGGLRRMLSTERVLKRTMDPEMAAMAAHCNVLLERPSPVQEISQRSLFQYMGKGVDVRGISLSSYN